MVVDELSQEFLKVLLEYGGDADTTTLRSETGMSRGQINHRYKKLNDLDWIEIDKAESGTGNRTPPKIAIITEDGMQAIRSGEAGPKVLGKEINEEEETLELTRDQLDSFYQEIEGMKNQLNVVVDQVNSSQKQDVKTVTKNEESEDSDRVQELENKVNTLQETVELLNKSVSEQRKNESEKYNELMEELDEKMEHKKVDEDLVMTIKNQQESINEWKNVAEIYMKAMRMYMKDDDDINVNEYFKKAKENM